MNVSRFDVVEAHWLFANDFHSGQGSALYAVLSRCVALLGTKHSGTWGRLTEEGREVYATLCALNAKRCPYDVDGSMDFTGEA